MWNNNKKQLTITHSGEALIWLTIICVIVLIGSLMYSNSVQVDNDYTIFMNDVDGLIVGSPVRMMGIEVGYVTKIQPTLDDMYVKFIITDKELNIPQGTRATVEFSGMAGSKSLELYLPQKDTFISSEVPIITVTSPKRLYDAVGLFNEMMDKIGSIIYSTSAFGRKFQSIDIPKTNENDAKKLIKYADQIIDDSNKKIPNIKSKKKDQKNDR